MMRQIRTNPPNVDLAQIDVILRPGETVDLFSAAADCGTCGTCVTCVTCVTT
jgi:hypothetical protein